MISVALARGMPVAFNSLQEKLQTAIKHAKGLWDDPGLEVARQRMQESPALFHIDDKVRWCSPWVDDQRDGEVLKIVAGYGLHKSRCDKGTFVDEDGIRIVYQWGYLVQQSDGKESFCTAGELQRMHYSSGHLRRWASNQRNRQGGGGAKGESASPVPPHRQARFDGPFRCREHRHPRVLLTWELIPGQ